MSGLYRPGTGPTPRVPPNFAGWPVTPKAGYGPGQALQVLVGCSYLAAMEAGCPSTAEALLVLHGLWLNGRGPDALAALRALDAPPQPPPGRVPAPGGPPGTVPVVGP